MKHSLPDKPAPSANPFLSLFNPSTPSPSSPPASCSNKKQKKSHAPPSSSPSLWPLFKLSPSALQQRQGSKLTIADFRDLALHLSADGSQRAWVSVSNRVSVRGTVVLLVPGLETANLGLGKEIPLGQILPFPLLPAEGGKSSLPVIQELFSVGIPVRSPGDQTRLFSAAQTVLTSPLSVQEKRRRHLAHQQQRQVTQASADAVLRPQMLRLDLRQMREQNYPIPSYLRDAEELPAFASASEESQQEEDLGEVISQQQQNANDDGWIETPLLHSDQEPNVIALDCEMVLTSAGSTLARLSVVNFTPLASTSDSSSSSTSPPNEKPQDELLLDVLVKVDGEITDYLTPFSGLTEQKMSLATATLAEVQQKLRSIIKPNTILVGHSLECDLRALKIRHPWVIDTAICFEHPRRAPYKPGLKWLANKWLSKTIQDDVAGHDSEQDARTCCELLRKKCSAGKDFGMFPSDMESIFERLSRCGRKGACVDLGNPGQWLGQKADTTIPCKTDSEVIDGLVEVVPSHDFVYGRLLGLSNAIGWTTGASTSDEADKAAINIPTPSDALEALQSQIKTLHDNLPDFTALIIISPHSDPRPALALSQRRNAFNAQHKANGNQNRPDDVLKWTAEEERALESEAEKAKWGFATMAIKLPKAV